MEGKLLKRISLLFLVLVLALAGFGGAYAAWTEDVSIAGSVETGSVCWEFEEAGSLHGSGCDWNAFWDLNPDLILPWPHKWVGPNDQIPWDGPDRMCKDVADTVVNLVDSHTISVLIDNAYPYYYDHVVMVVHGCGSVPLKFWKIVYKVDDTVVGEQYFDGEYHYLDLDGNDQDDLEIWWGNPLGTQLHYCNRYERSFRLLVLQPAPQTETLHFTIELVAIQWNKYTRGPLPLP